MWKALLWKDLRANALVFLGLWGAILLTAGLSLYEPWREKVVGGFTILAPMIVAVLLMVIQGTAEATQGTAPFLGSLPVSRRQVWGAKILLVGLHLLAVAWISRGLIAFLVHSWTVSPLEEQLQAAREAAVAGPIMLGLSLQAAAFVALLGFAWAVSSTSVKQATLRLLAWSGGLVAAAVLVHVWLGQAIFLETASQPVPDWLFRAVLLSIASILAGSAWQQTMRGGTLDVPLRGRRIGRAAFLGAASVALLATPIYVLSQRGTVRDIVRVDHARFSPDGRQLLLQTVTRRWGREFPGRLWWVDCEAGTAKPFGPGYTPEWSGVPGYPIQYHRWRWHPIGRRLFDPTTGRTLPLPLPVQIQRELRSGVHYQQLAVRSDTGEVFYRYPRPNPSETASCYLSPSSPIPRTFQTPKGQPLSFVAWDPGRSGAFMMAGEETVYAHAGDSLWWVELPSGRMYQVAHSDLRRLVADASLLSPDRQWLYYWAPRGEEAPTGEQTLRIVRFDGTGDRVVQGGMGRRHVLPLWSPDSQYLAAFRQGDALTPPKLIIHDRTSKVSRGFRVQADDPHFPRETWRATAYPMWKHLKPGRFIEVEHPVWSLDNRHLAFIVSQSGLVRPEEIVQGRLWHHQTASLWVLNRTAGRLRRVTTLSDLEYDQWDPFTRTDQWKTRPMALAWDAHGRVLVVTVSGDLFAADPETGEWRDVIRDP